MLIRWSFRPVGFAAQFTGRNRHHHRLEAQLPLGQELSICLRAPGEGLHQASPCELSAAITSSITSKGQVTIPKACRVGGAAGDLQSFANVVAWLRIRQAESGGLPWPNAAAPPPHNRPVRLAPRPTSP